MDLNHIASGHFEVFQQGYYLHCAFLCSELPFHHPIGRLIFMGTQQCSSELMCKSTTAEPCCSSSIRDAEGFSGHEPASVTLFFLLPYAACHCPFAEGRERAHSKERERKIISSYPRLLKYVIAVCVKNIIIVKVFVWLSE